MHFLTGFIQRYNETNLRELEVPAGFIIGGYNHNDMRYADDTVLTADSERKLE